jgi:hypothetical protein
MKALLRKTFRAAIVTTAVAAALVPAAQAQDDEFIAGYSDFPNALRVEGSGTFVPGHSDFPNHLRVDSAYDRVRGDTGVEERVVLVPAGGGFDWTDAGIGAGGAAGLILLATGGALLALNRRPSRRAALTG